MQNVLKLGSTEKDAAITALLETIALIRNGDVIGLTVIRTLSNLSVDSTVVLSPARNELIRSA